MPESLDEQIPQLRFDLINLTFQVIHILIQRAHLLRSSPFSSAFDHILDEVLLLFQYHHFLFKLFLLCGSDSVAFR